MKINSDQNLSMDPERKSRNIVNKQVLICSNYYIYTTIVQEVYNRDLSPEVDDVEGSAAAATKHLELVWAECVRLCNEVAIILLY